MHALTITVWSYRSSNSLKTHWQPCKLTWQHQWNMPLILAPVKNCYYPVGDVHPCVSIRKWSNVWSHECKLRGKSCVKRELVHECMCPYSLRASNTFALKTLTSLLFWHTIKQVYYTRTQTVKLNLVKLHYSRKTAFICHWNFSYLQINLQLFAIETAAIWKWSCTYLLMKSSCESDGKLYTV